MTHIKREGLIAEDSGQYGGSGRRSADLKGLTVLLMVPVIGEKPEKHEWFPCNANPLLLKHY